MLMNLLKIKNMKHIIYYLILACLVCSFTACSRLSKAAKYEAKLEECIAKRDFLSARNYYHKYAGLHLMGMGEERDQLLRKLNIAEMNYVMDQSGIEDAYFLADELGAKIEYLEVLAKRSSKFVNSNQTDRLLSMLVTWNFNYQFENSADWGYYRGRSIDLYNAENNAYNSILDVLLNYALFTEDKDLIQKVIKLYRPIAEAVVDRDQQWVRNQRNDQAKKDALKKVKDSGIKL
jgi:hypothetical protein